MNRSLIAIFFIIIVSVIFVKPIMHFSLMDTVENVMVTDKDRIVTSESSRYLIFTDKEVFENSDSFLAFKFRSSDYYSNIQVGDTCTFTVTGVRWGFMSWYRNILSYNCTR